MPNLSEKIDQHIAEGYHAFHSPAHAGTLNPRDLTELAGLDDLQYPEGVLRDSQDFVAELFGAKRSFFSVNGASLGMQASCLALKLYLNSINDQRPVLVARNVHKSVIAGIILAGLEVEWLEPEFCETLGVFTYNCEASLLRHCEGFSPKQSSQKYSALILTNPSYEGFSSNLNCFATLAITEEIPIIVDEAHGAHYQFSSQLPATALESGADIAVQSWHKTLGSLGQTGVIHLSKNSKIPEKFLEDSIRLLQTTSPSYLLLESITKTASLYKQQGKEIVERTIALSQSIEISRYTNDDPYRLIIPGPGHEIEKKLEEHKILIEAAYENFALLFINSGNTIKDIDALNKALESLDTSLRGTHRVTKQSSLPRSPRDAFLSGKTQIKAPCPPGIVQNLEC